MPFKKITDYIAMNSLRIKFYNISSDTAQHNYSITQDKTNILLEILTVQRFVYIGSACIMTVKKNIGKKLCCLISTGR